MKKIIFSIVWFALIILIWLGIEFAVNKTTQRFEPLKVDKTKRTASLNQPYFDDYFLFRSDINYTTSIANRAIFENKKKRYRIFCLGASTTAGYPYATLPPYDCPASFPNYLRTILQFNSEIPDIEMLNAACNSMNSQTVLSVTRDLVKYNPDVMIIYSAHNEYFGPNEFALSKEANQKFKSTAFSHAFLSLRQTYAYQGLSWIIRKIIGESAVSLQPWAAWAKVNVVSPDDPYNDGILENYEANLRKIVKMARENGVIVILCTPVTNYAFPPFMPVFSHELTDTEQSLWDSLTAKSDEFANDKDFESAYECWNELSHVDSMNANLHYFKGTYASKLGDYQTAVAELRRASDLDGLPFRAKSAAAGICRKVAADEGAILADMERFFSEMYGKGYPEPSLMLDHVHPTAAGYYYMGLFLAKTMAENQLFYGISEWKYPSREKTDQVLDIINFVVDKVEYDFAQRSYVKGLSKFNIALNNYLVNLRQTAFTRAKETGGKIIGDELETEKQKENEGTETK
ncbi:SGNH/GDSL hydrolase family protein [bacterium]|nr:SGNH/GDSL hydrolase family protein [bacterium]